MTQNIFFWPKSLLPAKIQILYELCSSPTNLPSNSPAPGHTYYSMMCPANTYFVAVPTLSPCLSAAVGTGQYMYIHWGLLRGTQKIPGLVYQLKFTLPSGGQNSINQLD
jgi:hypothetical protein